MTRQLLPTEKHIKDMVPGDAGWAVPWALGKFSKWGYDGVYLWPEYTIDTATQKHWSTLTAWIERTPEGWTAVTPEFPREVIGFFGAWDFETLDELLAHKTSIPVTVTMGSVRRSA